MYGLNPFEHVFPYIETSRRINDALSNSKKQKKNMINFFSSRYFPLSNQEENLLINKQNMFNIFS